jgi:AraC-like DNA-binding protein
MFRREIVLDNGYSGYNPLTFGNETCEPGHFFGPSVRTYWLLHYVVYGKGIFVRDGVTHEVNPGEIFVIPPYKKTYYEADKVNPWRYIWIGFRTNEQDFIRLEKPVLSCPRAGQIFEDMLRCDQLNNGRSAYLSGKLWELVSVLMEDTPESSDLVSKAKSYMQSEYVNEITVSGVAEKLGVNRSYLSEIFKEKTGISPQKYLITLRLEKAAELMVRFGQTPSTVAISTGYSDVYNFSRMFKKHFGLSPRDYIREQGGE